jgi:hypothetical protein
MTRILTLSEWNKNYCFQRRTSKPAINKLAPSAENIIKIMRILLEQMNFKVLPLICYLSSNKALKTNCCFGCCNCGHIFMLLGTLCLGECLNLKEETIGGWRSFPMQRYNNFYSLPDNFLVDNYQPKHFSPTFRT